MISRTTHELTKHYQRCPKRVFCWYPRQLPDGRVVWLSHVWTIRTEPPSWGDGGWTWKNYLMYDEALVNGYWYKKDNMINHAEYRCDAQGNWQGYGNEHHYGEEKDETT